MSLRALYATRSPEEQRQIEAARSHVAAGSEGVPALLEALETPSWIVRRAVVRALADLGDLAVSAACGLLRGRRDNEAVIAALVDALSASTGAPDEALLALTTDPDPAVATDAVQVLGRRRSSAAIPRLAELTQHPDDNVAVGAIEALGRIHGRAAIDSLIAVVRGGNFFRAFPAIEVLGRSGDPRAVAPLAALLGDPRYAYEATRALGRTGHKSAVAPLAGLLSRPSGAMARVAATALAALHDQHRELYGLTDALDASLREIRDVTAVSRLSQMLEGASAVEQASLCRLLGSLGSDNAVPSLTRLLDAPEPVASAAADALKRLGRVADAQLLQALREGDSARRLVLLPHITARWSATSEVLRCLGDADVAVRAAACDTLARIGDPAVVPRLFSLLSDPNQRLVQAAVGAIQSLGSAETEALTLVAARSDAPQVRRAAFRIISYFGYASALDLLVGAIQESDDERLRDSAIYGLPFIEDPRAEDALLATARHPDARARAAAMRALGQYTSEPRVISCLQEGLSDADAWVRYYAAQSLGKLAWGPAAESIAALLEDDAGQVRVAAIEALSHIQSDVAFTALRETARSEDADMQRAALVGLGIGQRPVSLPILLEAASAQEPTTRLVAVSALAEFDAPEVLAALGQAAADADESVRTAALTLLAARSTVEATRVLIALARAAEPHERALAALSIASEGRIIGLFSALEAADDELAPLLAAALARMRHEDATAALIKALSLPNVSARKAAAEALGEIGSSEALEALERAAYEDADPVVRRICSLALGH